MRLGDPMAKPRLSKKRQARARKKQPNEGQKDLNPNAVSEEMIDKTLADSFPASDPPSWTTGREHIDHEGADTEWNSAKSRRKNR